MLALASRLSYRLLIGHVTLERERTNLARYFSSNVVEELSHNDEPLKRVRTHDIAVLFVDIVGFTAFAAGRTPEATKKPVPSMVKFQVSGTASAAPATSIGAKPIAGAISRVDKTDAGSSEA